MTVNISEEKLEITDEIEQAIKDVLQASLTKKDTKKVAQSLIEALKPEYEKLYVFFPPEYISKNALEQLMDFVKLERKVRNVKAS